MMNARLARGRLSVRCLSISAHCATADPFSLLTGSAGSQYTRLDNTVKSDYDKTTLSICRYCYGSNTAFLPVLHNRAIMIHLNGSACLT